MKNVLMMRAGKVLVDTCAGVKKGEKVLIVTDPNRMHIAEVLMAVLYEREIDTTVCVIKENEMDGQEPSDAAAAAMMVADVLLVPTSKSIAHATAVKNAIRNGARMLAISALTDEEMIKGGIFADFDKERVVCDRFGDHFTNATTVRVTSKSGTDFTASLVGRKGNSMPCIARNPGEYTGVPNIEANVSPVEGTANGVLIIDGSIPNFGIGLIKTPIKLVVKDGSIVEISGGSEAVFLESLLKSVNSPAAYNIAQVAVGLNPECKNLKGIHMNDHGCYGRVHIGIGTSTFLGGEIKAPIHFDVFMECTTLEFDGKAVIQEGVIVG